jgi:hypothetical protein
MDYEQSFDEYIDGTADELEQQRQEALRVALDGFGIRLNRLAEEQVKKKSDIEQRWKEDLRAYHGKYSDAELSAIKANNGSQAYVNITRAKCNAAESRLVDMLFPADDRNWSITSTPVPELHQHLNDHSMMTGADGEQVEVAQIAQMAVEQAERAAKAMERQIEDQLIEADYAARSRDCIHDAVVLGSGIIKAPVVEGRVTRKWHTQEDGTSTLEIIESIEPTVEVVSPWDYFPDMSARNKRECDFEFERKFMTRKQVRDMLKLPSDSIMTEQVIRVLEQDPTETRDDRFDEVRQISGDSVNTTRNRYTLWEYHGEITPTELEAAGVEVEGAELGVRGTVLILEGKVIRVSLNPLETEESPYSIFNWEVDSNSLFGYGVPYLVRHPQKIINAATRMMLDNARLSVAPQIGVNKKLIRPADGSWKISPMKTWYMTEDTIPLNQALQFVNIPSNQGDLANIYQLGRGLMDETSNIPMIATGEGDPNATMATATGVSILSGAAKVVFKRVVKNFDDDFTVPTIRRFYDWNMQYSDNPEIKGDMRIDAKGSTALMAREQEATLMAEVLQMIDPAEIQMRIKPEEALREFFKSRSINASTILRTDEEVEQIMATLQEQAGQQPDPESAKLQMQMQIEQSKLQQKEMEAQIQMQRWNTEAQQKEQQMMMHYELEMSKLAAQQQTTVEKLKQQSGSMETKVMLEQMKAQNKREVEQMRIETQRQIAAIKAQQTENKQAMQMANLRAGYDTF